MKIQLSDIQKYGQLQLLAKKAVEGFITGLHRSPYNGFSVNAPTTNTTGSSIQGKVQWDISSYNAISVEPTIINDTTIQYISPGFTSDVETINASFLPVGGTAPVLNISGDV